jgi:hypothetical protein
MKHFNKIIGGGIAALVSGCSSPPLPPSVEWTGQANEINTTLPEWKENSVVVPSASVTGSWSKVITGFGEDNPYQVDVFYAVAHSPKIVVSTNSSDRYFSTKDWLRSHGARGTIAFSPRKMCLSCQSTDIYFYNSAAIVADMHRIHPGIVNKTVVPKPVIKSTPLVPPHTMPVSRPVTPNSIQRPAGKPVMPITGHPAPSIQSWQIAKGTTLREGVTLWAKHEPCANGQNWTVIWETPVEYSIDAPLSFTGDFKAAINALFDLYKDARTPLHVVGNQQQCLIEVRSSHM